MATKPVKILPAFCILVMMATGFASLARPRVDQLAQDPRVSHAVAWIGKNLDWVAEQQVRITEVPAPPFQEARRAAVLKNLLEEAGLKARLDSVGNVVAERAGTDSKSVLLLCAHLDTVFPPGTDVHVRRDSGRLIAPGIADNGAGLAALVAVARALEEGRVPTRETIVFAADVGEEGEGNLRGMRELVAAYRQQLRSVIALDGSAIDHITTGALASRRLEVTVTGPGGHSWSDFGEPNPINALARGIARFLETQLPASPRTTFNIGSIEGGLAVNAIPERASIKVDLRSESEAELERLEKSLRDAIAAGVTAESAAAKHDGEGLQIRYRSLGIRPGGELPAGSPLLEAIQEVDRSLGLQSRFERSSTDANIPLSLGIPAIAIGGGGHGGGAHSLEEWYDPADRELGLKRILLTVVTVAGLAP